MHVILNGEALEEGDCLKYLGSQVAADGGCEREVVHRMNDRYGAWGTLKNVLNNRGLGIQAKKCRCEGVIVPTALCRAEAWGMKSSERRKVNVLEIKCYNTMIFYIMFNPVIDIGTNYFVLWNEFHITVLFMLKGYNSSLP